MREIKGKKQKMSFAWNGIKKRGLKIRIAKAKPIANNASPS